MRKGYTFFCGFIYLLKPIVVNFFIYFIALIEGILLSEKVVLYFLVAGFENSQNIFCIELLVAATRVGGVCNER